MVGTHLTQASWLAGLLSSDRSQSSQGSGGSGGSLNSLNSHNSLRSLCPSFSHITKSVTFCFTESRAGEPNWVLTDFNQWDIFKNEVCMKKKVKNINSPEFVSKKRTKEISDIFKALHIFANQPYHGAVEFSRGFQRVSLYESDGVLYTTTGHTNE